jgi:outer membrane protein assembly factor BamB
MAFATRPWKCASAIFALTLTGMLSPLLADDGVLLREAARKGDAATVKALIDKKVDLNAATEYGVTALALACNHGHEEVAKALLDAGANPNTKDRFYRASPLTWAVSKQNMAIVQALVKHGAEDIDSVIGAAVGTRNASLLQILVDSGKASEKARLEALTPAKAIASAAPNAEEPKKIIAILEKSLPAEAIVEFEKRRNTSADVEKLKPYEGMYQSEAGVKMNLRIANGRLQAFDPEGERGTPLEAEENDTFTSRGLTVRFTKEKDSVATMLWKVGDRETTFKKLPPGAADAKPSVDATADLPKVELGADFPLASEHWPSFRGVLARGINDARPIATQWDGATGKNIAWKLAIDGLATSSPVTWGNDLFVTTAVQGADEKGFKTGAYGDVESVEVEGECSYQLWCVNLATGELKWKQEAAKEIPKVKRHLKSSHANPTPATDGKHVIAFFGGAGLYCYDMQGSLRWKKDLGVLDSGWFYDKSYQWGFGSSPFLFEDLVIVQCDAQDECFVMALDAETGETRWKTARVEIPTWSSPVAFYAPQGTPTVIATGTKCTAGYHARTGELLWSMGGFSEIVVPTPQVTPEVALLTSGYAPVQPIVALKHSARGELKIPEDGKPTGPFLWSLMRGGPYMPTPVVFENRVYSLDNGGILTCLDLGTGTRVFRQRLRGDKATAYTASPVAAGGRLYCTSEEGHTYVVSLDKEGKTIAENDLGESVLASPAIAQGKLLLRGEKHLYAIAEKEE